MAFRKLKKQVIQLLQAEDFEESLKALLQLPARQVVNPLFSLLYHGDDPIRWRAVSAMGAVVAQLADRSLEEARVIMRRLMWNLNDESGGIGWGSPEAMGEAMAKNPQLAREYDCILVSYLNPQGNFLEHEGLQRGVLWAIGRMARVQPEHVRAAVPCLTAFLTSSNSELRGLALWAAKPFTADLEVPALIDALRRDETVITIYDDGRLGRHTVSDLAGELLRTAEKH